MAKVKWLSGGDANGTYLMGTVHTTYEKLCEVFGPPHNAGDGDKTRVEWVLTVKGRIVTIYDWKEYNTPVESVRDWHIGGRERRVLYDVEQALLG